MEDFDVPIGRTIGPSALSSIPVFNPKDENPRQWLNTLEKLAGVFGWTPDQKVQVARCRLGGSAQIWEEGMGAAIGTWAEFKEALIARFAVSEEELLQQLSTCKQERNESVRAYADRFRHLLTQLGMTGADAEGRVALRAYKSVFIRGLQPAIREKVYIFEYPDLESAIAKAISSAGLRL